MKQIIQDFIFSFGLGFIFFTSYILSIGVITLEVIVIFGIFSLAFSTIVFNYLFFNRVFK